MNSCGAFCSYCGKCGRKIDERLVRNKPTHVAPPGAPLHGVAREDADGDRLPREKDVGKQCACGSA